MRKLTSPATYCKCQKPFGRPLQTSHTSGKVLMFCINPEPAVLRICTQQNRSLHPACSYVIIINNKFKYCSTAFVEVLYLEKRHYKGQHAEVAVRTVERN